MKSKVLAALSAAAFLLASCGGGEARTLEDDIVQYESIYYWNLSQNDANELRPGMSSHEICLNELRQMSGQVERYESATWTPEIQADVDQVVAALEGWMEYWEACEDKFYGSEDLGHAVGTLHDSLGVETVKVGSTYELRRI
jgi:hypothetical protein